MNILITIGKIITFPLRLIIATVLGMVWLAVKVIMGIYEFCRGLFGILMAICIIAAAFCYHDPVQTILWILLSAASLAVIVVGTVVEVSLETAIPWLIFGSTRA